MTICKQNFREINQTDHPLELRKLKISHAGLGRGPPPKASTAVGHQTHAIGSVNAIYMY